MNEIMNISGIECYEQDGTAYLKLETVARGLGFTEIAASGNECVKWTRVRKYLADLGFIDTSVDGGNLPDFIPENVFYRLAMKAKNEAAEAFQAKIADEVIPSIRRTGGYVQGQGAPRSAMELLRLQSRAMFELDDRVTSLEDKVERQMTIDHGQQRELQRAVSGRVMERLATVVPARMVDERKRFFFQALYHDLKDRFAVPSYRDIRPSDYPDAMEYVAHWVEPAHLRGAEAKEVRPL